MPSSTPHLETAEMGREGQLPGMGPLPLSSSWTPILVFQELPSFRLMCFESFPCAVLHRVPSVPSNRKNRCTHKKVGAICALTEVRGKAVKVQKRKRFISLKEQGSLCKDGGDALDLDKRDMHPKCCPSPPSHPIPQPSPPPAPAPTPLGVHGRVC